MRSNSVIFKLRGDGKRSIFCEYDCLARILRRYVVLELGRHMLLILYSPKAVEQK